MEAKPFMDPPLGLSWISWVHFAPYFMVHFNIILPLTPRSHMKALPFRSCNACYMPFPAHPPWWLFLLKSTIYKACHIGSTVFWVPPKRRAISEPHGVTTQTTALLRVTAAGAYSALYSSTVLDPSVLLSTSHHTIYTWQLVRKACIPVNRM
jgi:hypothetical protein